MKVRIRETPEGPQEPTLTIVLDGYNAPVSAGQFMDLVQRKFYDGMEIQRADGFVVQTGDPDGPETGFVDGSGNLRTCVDFGARLGVCDSRVARGLRWAW
jgi:cyclophilin family peptidyl-prolyl cis-trans isomerase